MNDKTRYSEHKGNSPIFKFEVEINTHLGPSSCENLDRKACEWVRGRDGNARKVCLGLTTSAIKKELETANVFKRLTPEDVVKDLRDHDVQVPDDTNGIERWTMELRDDTAGEKSILDLELKRDEDLMLHWDNRLAIRANDVKLFLRYSPVYRFKVFGLMPDDQHTLIELRCPGKEAPIGLELMMAKLKGKLPPSTEFPDLVEVKGDDSKWMKVDPDFNFKKLWSEDPGTNIGTSEVRFLKSTDATAMMLEK